MNKQWLSMNVSHGESEDWAALGRKTGDDEAFRRLYERRRRDVYRMAFGLTGDRHLADDATQELFLRLHSRRGEFTPRAKFSTFLYGMTRNVVSELKRRTRAEPLGAVDDQATVAPSTGEDETTAKLKRLSALLNRLPDRQREVVALRFLQGLSVTETATVMGCEAGTVKSHLHWAMRTMRDLAKRGFFDE